MVVDRKGRNFRPSLGPQSGSRRAFHPVTT